MSREIKHEVKKVIEKNIEFTFIKNADCDETNVRISFIHNINKENEEKELLLSHSFDEIGWKASVDAAYNTLLKVYTRKFLLDILSESFKMESAEGIIDKVYEILCQLFNLGKIVDDLVIEKFKNEQIESQKYPVEVSYKWKEEKVEINLEKEEKLNWCVDIPNTNIEEGKENVYVNVYTAKSRKEAIEWAKEQFGCDDNGMINLISNSN
jgi:hypothetical protein